MKKSIILLFIFSSLLACKTQPEDTSEQEVKKGQEKAQKELNEGEQSPCLAILPEIPLDFDEQDYNFTTIDTAYFKNGNIHIAYQYSGCTDGEPVLAQLETASGKRSTVIKLNLKVKDAGLCEMLLSKESCFTLAETAVVGKEFQIILNGENSYFYRP